MPGATVDFAIGGPRQIRQNRGHTAADGSFQFGAAPGAGLLVIRAASDDYVLREIGDRMLRLGEPGGFRRFAHAFRELDLKPGVGSQEAPIVLRRGTTVAGQVVGPDGQPIGDASIFGRGILDQRRGTIRTWSGRIHSSVHGVRFEVRGLDPGAKVPVYFLEPRRKLGAVVNLCGKSAAAMPLTVRLEPCSAAKARVVGPGGKPMDGPLPRGFVAMVVTPGPTFSQAKDQADALAADEGELNVIDTVNYPTPIAADAQGRLTLPALIPGATYRFIDRTTAVRGETGPQVRKEFTVKPGETLDLGDILVEKPGT